jgi:hypothetical protein
VAALDPAFAPIPATAPAPVVTASAPAPVVTATAPAPVVTASAPAPVVTASAPVSLCAPADVIASRGRVRVLVTAVAVALSVALELTGPPRPFLFSLRLPLVVLVIGAIWTQARRQEYMVSSRPPVPMATPGLILSLTAGTAAMIVKLVSVSPALTCAMLSVASAACCLAVGLLVMGGRRRRTGGRSGLAGWVSTASRPRTHKRPLAGGMPGQPVSPVGVDAGGELRVEHQRA